MKGSRLLVVALVATCVPALGVAVQPAARPFEPASSTDGGPQILPQDFEVELALSAGPEHLRADATVYVFAKDGYDKVRVGSNRFTCLVNRDGLQAGVRTLRPTCWDAEGGRTIVPVTLRVGELLARRKSADEVRRDIDAGFNQGLFSSPHKAGIAYMLRGDLQVNPQSQRSASSPFHLTT